MRIIGVVLALIGIGGSVGTFYGIFFKLTPWICGAVPDGDWKRLIDILVYLAVGWIGGLSLPVMILVLFVGFAKVFIEEGREVGDEKRNRH